MENAIGHPPIVVQNEAIRPVFGLPGRSTSRPPLRAPHHPFILTFSQFLRSRL